MSELSALDVEYLFSLQQKNNLFEDILKDIYIRTVRPGDWVIDGGAHAGMHTLPMAQVVGEQGKVFAFEPIPYVLAKLREKVAEMPQVVTSECALASDEGTTEFHLVKNSPWYSGIAQRSYPFDPEIEILNVPKTTLDAFLMTHPGWEDAANKLSFCKLDLEGGEFPAIRGAKHLMTQTRLSIVFEHGRFDAARMCGYSEADFFAFFSDMQYELYDIFGRPFGIEAFRSPFVTEHKVMPWYQIAAPAENLDAIDASRAIVTEILTARRTSA